MTDNKKNSDQVQKSSFSNLDAIILSIEWEITEQTMTGLISEINRLKKIYKNNRIIYSFLQLHDSVAKYIRAKKVNSHPDSIKLLHSIYNALNKVTTSSEMTETKMKSILSAEVKKFKELKQKVISNVTSLPKEVGAKPTSIARPQQLQKKGDYRKSEIEAEAVTFDKALGFVLEELKKTIKTEFAALRKELKR